MTDPSVGGSPPAHPDESDTVLAFVREIQLDADPAFLAAGMNHADDYVAICYSLQVAFERMAEHSRVPTEHLTPDMVASIGGAAAHLRRIERAFRRVGEALEAARSAQDATIRAFLESSGIDAVRLSGYRYALAHRNDMAIVDLDAAINDARRRGWAFEIMTEPKPDRTKILKLARDLEAHPDLEPLAGCERQRTAAFAVKEL